MYVHAYQSYVWNVVVSARMRLGTNVLEGDLVLINSTTEEVPEIDDPDQGGEFSISETENQDKVAVKILTEQDVNTGTYTIHDIVLPTPGYDVTYPSRDELRQAYVESMSPDGLDPFNMRRVVREVSMVGHYRRVVHRPENVQWEILRYNGKDTILDNTDELPQDGEFMALRVQLRLGTSQYATMALREICKRDSVHVQFWGKERDELDKVKKLEAEKLENEV
jgi:tRNA pseudouridine13 synthase